MTKHQALFTPRRRPCSLWSAIILAAVLGLSCLASAEEKTAAVKSFDIPADAANKSFKRFSAQSGLEIAFGTATSTHVRTNAVKGDFAPREAMTLLLAGTGLAAEADPKTGAWTIFRDPNVQRAAQVRPSTRRPIGNNDDSATTARDETVTLSPFTVTAEEDTGYLASSTMAGTRLRTQLKDVAAAVSVITQDYMQDINADTIEELFLYTTNTEVGDYGGNFSGVPRSADFVNFDGGGMDPVSPTRVRGLGSADITRDYLLSDIPLDRAFVDRVEISRGPNALLYGLGSPSGIVNSTMAKANLQRMKTKVSVKYGQYGTHREVLDHNHVILEDKLAVRIIGTYGKTYYRVEEPYQQSKKGYAAITYRPLENTTVRINTEMGRNKGIPIRQDPPLDNFTWWWDIGQPINNPSIVGNSATLTAPVKGPLSGLNANGSPSNLLSGMDKWANNALGLIYTDPFSSAIGIDIPGEGVIQATKSHATRALVNANGALVDGRMRSLITNRVYLRNQRAGQPDQAYWIGETISDPAIFDFYHHQAIGPNGYAWADWRAHNIAVEQRLFGGKGGVELVWDYQKMDNGAASPDGRVNLQLDINSHLIDGTPNPNFLRPFVTSSGHQTSRSITREAYRGTAYYELDLRRKGPGWLGKLLGRHIFTGAHTDQDILNYSARGRPFIMDIDHSMLETNGGGILGGNSQTRDLMRVSYIGPSVAGATGPANVGITGIRADHWPDHLQTVRAWYYQPPLAGSTQLNSWGARNFNVLSQTEEVDRTISSASRTRDHYKSTVLIWNNYMFERTIVGTLGWRWENFENFTAGGGSNVPLNPANNLAMTDESVWPLLPRFEGKERAFNWGVAGHVPQFIRRHLPLGADLSVYYNVSDNFRPERQRYNEFDEPIPPQTGDTKEWGARLSFFDGKLHLRATRFTTVAGGAPLETQLGFALRSRIVPDVDSMYTQISRGLRDDQPEAKAAFLAWTETPGAQQFFKTFRFEFLPQPDGSLVINRNTRAGEVVTVADQQAKGWEFELVYNPLRNWRIAVNASQTEAVRTKSARDFGRLMDEVISPMLDSPAGDLIRSGTQTWRTRDNNSARIPLLKERLLEGSKQYEGREWHASLVTNYSFREGFLKGVGITGRVRWQDKAAIGNPIIVDPVSGGIPDVFNPYYGPDETFYGAQLTYTRNFKRFKWRIGLDIENIGVGNELTPVAAQPDGSIAVWRIKAPTRWSVSNSFEF